MKMFSLVQKLILTISYLVIVLAVMFRSVTDIRTRVFDEALIWVSVLVVIGYLATISVDISKIAENLARHTSAPDKPQAKPEERS